MRQRPRIHVGRPARWERWAAMAAAVLITLGLAILAGLGGCGEKITIPEASGLFGVTTYYKDDTFVEPAPVQVAIIKGYLFVLSGVFGLRD